jgi:hypothetical protein
LTYQLLDLGAGQHAVAHKCIGNAQHRRAIAGDEQTHLAPQRGLELDIALQQISNGIPGCVSEGNILGVSFFGAAVT